MKTVNGCGRLVLAGLAIALMSPLPSRASLGRDVSSVEADRADMQGARAVTQGTGYSIEELRAPTGTTVREYVGSDGRVFGVAWQGPFIPNLRQLLGSYFDPFSQAAQAQKKGHPGHGPLLVQVPGLVVESGGHMRAFYGRAYVPGMVPAGAAAEGIR